MPTGRDRGGRRGRGGSLGALALGLLAVIAVVALIGGGLPSLNPFGSDTVDRSQPAVLRSIEKLTEYRAATANLQVIVDVERDVDLVPSWLKGEKTLLVAGGRVDASVDFSGLGEESVEVDEDARRATITLPPPVLADPQLDLDRTRVYDRDRGLLDRVESVFEDSPTEDREVMLLAEQKLLEAAAADASLRELAERNTREMLAGLLAALGFEDVTVRFSEAAAAEPRD